MAAPMVFRSLTAALEAGFTVYDKLRDGYLVRKRSSAGWVLAIVSFGDRPQLPEHPDSSQLDHGIRHLKDTNYP